MRFNIRYSTIKSMLTLIEKLQKGNLVRSDVESMVGHEDYQVEFMRYADRVSKEQYIEYLLKFPNLKPEAIENKDFRNHHEYYLDLYNNLDFYLLKVDDLNRLTPELFSREITLALKGLPDDLELDELNFLFTVGIGQSFGYVYKNNMHFDFLQLVKEKSVEEICSSMAHEVHHVGLMTYLDGKLNFDDLSVECFFYVYFSGEGLAVKYCNNAEGVLSKSIYNGTINIGLDVFTWEYLKNDFEDTMNHFKDTVVKIRMEKMDKHNLNKVFQEYWMNTYIEGQSDKELPKLKHDRMYSFGNEIWGIIHDCFGKDMVYKTLLDLKTFPDIYNSSLQKLGRDEYKI